MISGFRSLRVETSQEYIKEWFENDFRENLEDYLTEVSPSTHKEYDVQVKTNIDTADLRNEISADGEYTDVYVEVSGGELAVDSALNAFDELWTDADFPERAENS